MPCRVYSNMNCSSSTITADEIVQKIRDILIIDCRLPSDYEELHIRGSINISLPSSILMMRRVTNGQLCLKNIIKDSESRDKFLKFWKSGLIVLYEGNLENEWNQSSVITILCRRLEKDGCRTVCLQGGFDYFKTKFPEWCENQNKPIEPTLLGLENLCITAATTTDAIFPDTSPDLPFPIEIIPWLFLGNADNSSDLDALNRYKIRYILNVTPNLPNMFQQNELGIKYLQIPIQDNWSQKILPFFSEAIAFIDEARDSNQGVLVHCLAGISRSVTITLAYLMHTLNISLNDAYDLVKKRKSNISPNFNFMEQLVDYERQLNLTPCNEDWKCPNLLLSPVAGTTPDSGIQIDQWE